MRVKGLISLISKKHVQINNKETMLFLLNELGVNQIKKRKKEMQMAQNIGKKYSTQN